MRNTRFKLLSALSVGALALVVGASNALAAPLYRLDFDNDGTANNNALNPYQLSTNDVSPEVIDRLDPTSGTIPKVVTNTGSGLALQLVTPTTGNAGYLARNTTGYTTIPAGGGLTLECSFYLNSYDPAVTPFQGLISQFGTGGISPTLRFQNGTTNKPTILFSISGQTGGDVSFTPATTINGGWHTLAGVYHRTWNATQSRVELYLDGTLVNSTNYTTSSTQLFVKGGIAFGGDAPGASTRRALNGQLDNVAITLSPLDPGSFVFAPRGSVTVAASTNIGESGEDDLTHIRSFFRSSSRPEANGGLTNVWPQASDIGMNGERLINIDGGCVVDGSGNFTPGSRYLDGLNDCKAYNLIPWLLVGQAKPDYMPASPWTWNAATWAQYDDYCYRFLKYAVAQHTYMGGTAGFSTIRVEVTNEWHAQANIWPLQNDPGPFDSSRFEAMMDIYKHWATAAQRVNNEIPGKTIIVGGPTSTSDWAVQFIQRVASENLRMDNVTFHYYGGDASVGGANFDLHNDGSSLIGKLNSIQNALNSAGRGSVPISITEWCPYAFNGKVNYSNEGAAWTAAFFKDALAGGADFSQPLLYTDGVGADPGVAAYAGNPSLWHHRGTVPGNDYPKSFVNTCKMINLMPGSRKAVTTPANFTGLGALASGAPWGASVMVWNSNYAFDWANGNHFDRSAPKKIQVQFNNLQFTGAATLQHYIIDATNSNLGKYIDNNLTPVLSGCQLTKVSDTAITITGNSYTPPAETMDKASVSLWVITK